MTCDSGGASTRPLVRLAKAGLCLALLGLLPGRSSAFDIDYEVGVAAEHSDNIARSEDDPVADTAIGPRLSFSAQERGSRVKLTAEGSVAYDHYVDDTWDDQTRSRLTGRLDWAILPQRLDFVVQDSLSVQPVDQFTAFSAANQQQVNVLNAGPTLYARFGSATRGQLDLRYLDTYAEQNEAFNSQRYTVAARVIHDVSPTTQVSANLQGSDVTFDLIDRASDYRRYDGYVSYVRRGRHLDTTIDAGGSRIDFDSAATTTGGDRGRTYPLARVTANWRMSPSSTISATLRHQVTDAAESLLTSRDVDFGLDRDVRSFTDFRTRYAVVEPNLLRERFARVGYSYRRGRANLRVNPYYRHMRYIEGLVPDQKRRGVIADLDFQLKPRTTLTAYASAQRREYMDGSREDRDRIAGIGVSHRFTRHWTGQVDFEHRSRDSTTAGRGFDENAVILGFSYRR